MKYLMVAFLLVTGCAGAPKMIQKNYDPKGGVISYETSSSGSPAKAERMIAEYCDGKYKILSEAADTELRGALINRGVATPVYRKKTNVAFRCD